jgi:hypothetical protein
VNLVLGSLDSEGEPSLRRVNLFAEPQDVFKVNADASVRRLAARRGLVPYAPGYKPEVDEVLFVDLTAEPDVLAVVEAVGQLQRQEPYGGDEAVAGRSGFSATVIGAQRGKKAMFFSQFTPKNELARSRLTAIIQGRTGFDIVRERVLLFDADADCIAWSGYAFIRSMPAFERIFSFFERARRRVDEVVATIVRAIPISNVEAFQASCRSQPQMIAKTLSVGRKPYLGNVSMERIKRIIAEYGLALRTEGEEGQEKLVFENDPQRRWLILKLLDDDYLYSEMTDARYAANSKSPVGGPG